MRINFENFRLLIEILILSFLGLITAFLIYSTLNYFYEKKYEDNFINISFIDTMSTKEVNIFFFSNDKKKCIFNFIETGSSKKHTIDFSEDIEFIVKKKSNTFLIKTLDNKFFAIFHADNNSMSEYKEHLVNSYFNHCQLIKDRK